MSVAMIRNVGGSSGGIDPSLFPDTITLRAVSDTNGSTHRYCDLRFDLPTLGVYTKANLSTTGTPRTPYVDNCYIIVHKADGTSIKYPYTSNSAIIDISDSISVEGRMYANIASYCTCTVTLTKQ